MEIMRQLTSKYRERSSDKKVNKTHSLCRLIDKVSRKANLHYTTFHGRTFIGQTKPVGQYSLHSWAILAYYKNKWDKFYQFCREYAI
jgi:hypothetical protein